MQYSCFTCGVRRASLEVPARTVEDVKAWVDDAVRRVFHDHWRRFPACSRRTLDELMIPMPEGTAKVGGPVEH